MQALEKNPDHIKNGDQEHQYRLAQQVRTLSLPSEMGERFKCIALTKKMDETLDKVLNKDRDNSLDKTPIGFREFDQRYRL